MNKIKPRRIRPDAVIKYGLKGFIDENHSYKQEKCKNYFLNS